jgi:hypothetical protein
MKKNQDQPADAAATTVLANPANSQTYVLNRVPNVRSAGFQPAVSPTSSRQGVKNAMRSGPPDGWRIGNPRYSRLEVCATPGGFRQQVKYPG